MRDLHCAVWPAWGMKPPLHEAKRALVTSEGAVAGERSRLRPVEHTPTHGRQSRAPQTTARCRP